MAGSVATQAQYTIYDQNSSATVDVNGPGMTSWYIDGQNQLQQQWFWYRIGGVGAGNVDKPINTIGAASVGYNPSFPSSLTSTYQNSQLRVLVKYSMTGQDSGSGGADIAETIQIKNVSSTPYVLHFFQYSHFILGGSPGGQSSSLSIDSASFKYSGAIQTKSGLTLNETQQTSDIPYADHGEAAQFHNTLDALGTSYDLNDNVSSGPPGDPTWALEWDISLAANQSLTINKQKAISGVVVPEPASLALGLFGLGSLWLFRKRK
jgi:hypothetical protein